jgi:hypothetical protein
MKLPILVYHKVTTDLYALRRISVSCDTTLRRFAWDLFRLRWFCGS